MRTPACSPAKRNPPPLHFQAGDGLPCWPSPRRQRLAGRVGCGWSGCGVFGAAGEMPSRTVTRIGLFASQRRPSRATFRRFPHREARWQPRHHSPPPTPGPRSHSTDRPLPCRRHRFRGHPTVPVPPGPGPASFPRDADNGAGDLQRPAAGMRGPRSFIGTSAELPRGVVGQLGPRQSPNRGD